MKYKLKFEITYPDLDKDEIRDLKLDGVLSSDIVTEVESDQPVGQNIVKDTKIILGDVEYITTEIKYGLEKDCYVTIICVVNKEAYQRMIEKKEEEERDLMRQRIGKMMR